MARFSSALWMLFAATSANSFVSAQPRDGGRDGGGRGGDGTGGRGPGGDDRGTRCVDDDLPGVPANAQCLCQSK